jgi:glucokinase
MNMPDRVVAIDVGGTNLKGAVVDRHGRCLSSQRRPTGAEGGSEAVVDAVVGLAQELASSSTDDEDSQAVATGIAVPGLVDESTGTVQVAANLGWRDLPIGPIAQERLGIPVTISHDVRAGALAEGLLGAARGSSDYLLITLGTGIGAAVVLDGRPYVGAHGVGGELGHMAIESRGPMCGCGRAGCLESLASAGHVSARYGSMTDSDEPVGAEEVAERAASGDDPVAEQVWSEAIDALALGIANYAALLDPELVVIGGGMAAAGDRLFAPLRRRLIAHTRFGEPPRVVATELGEDAGRHGAAIAAWRAVGLDERELATWEP